MFSKFSNSNKFINLEKELNNSNNLDQEIDEFLEYCKSKYGRNKLLNIVDKLHPLDVNEPLLDKSKRSFVAPIHPIYSKVNEFYKLQQSAFWKVEELDFSRDYDDFLTLNKNEQHFIEMILAFFAASDGIVNFNLSERFTREITNQETLIAYRFQMMMEDIHSDTYSKMLENIVRDKDKQKFLFNAIENIPSIKKIADWAFKWIDSSERFAYRIIAFAIVEAVFFSGAFAAIFWIKKYKNGNSEKKSFMNGLNKSNGFIARDEGMHALFACELYSHVVNRLSFDEIKNMMIEAVDIAKEFMTESIPVRMIGMNDVSMCKYIEYVADRLLSMLGYDKIFKTTNPFKFMETIGLKNKANFFEERSNDYQDPHINNTTEDDQYHISDDF